MGSVCVGGDVGRSGYVVGMWAGVGMCWRKWVCVGGDVGRWVCVGDVGRSGYVLGEMWAGVGMWWVCGQEWVCGQVWVCVWKRCGQCWHLVGAG